jgi:hypothetical protein
MPKIAFIIAMSLCLCGGSIEVAQAKGCIKGAVIGGVAGHLAHHHTAMGAAVGCAVGVHEAHKQMKQQRDERAHGGR